jgi:MSHA biogenesis protein MshQ
MRKIWRGAVLTLGGAGLATTLTLAGCGGADDGAQPTPTPGISLSGLVLLMHFDEGAWTGAAGEVADSSGLGNNGTAIGGATTVAGGKFGRAGSFDQWTGVKIPDSAGLHATNAVTVTAWVYPRSQGNGNWRGIVAKRVDYTQKAAYTLYISTDNRLCADIDTEDDRFCSTATLGSDQWFHVGMVYDGGQVPAARVSLYINGQLSGVGSEASASIRPFDSPLWIGSLPLTQADQSTLGLVDEVAVWYRILDSKDIRALAQATEPLTR